MVRCKKKKACKNLRPLLAQVHLKCSANGWGPNDHQGCLVFDQVFFFVLGRHDQFVAQHPALADPAVDTSVLWIIHLRLVVAEGCIQRQVVREVAPLHHRQRVLRVHLKVQDVGVASAGRESDPQRILWRVGRGGLTTCLWGASGRGRRA